MTTCLFRGPYLLQIGEKNLEHAKKNYTHYIKIEAEFTAWVSSFYTYAPFKDLIAIPKKLINPNPLLEPH